MTRLGAITVGAVAAAVIAACGGGMTGTTTVQRTRLGQPSPTAAARGIRRAKVVASRRAIARRPTRGC